MSHYFFANIRINNKAEYQKYLDKVDEVFDKYNGEYLAVDESPVILEGQWNFTKSVLIRFNNRKDFDDWYYSADYQEILKHRLGSSDSDAILVKGLE